MLYAETTIPRLLAVLMFATASATEPTRDFCGLFPCILPNMPQAGAITAQNRDFLSAQYPFDHIFAHRQRKAAPPGILAWK